MKSKFIKPHICSGMVFADLGRVFLSILYFSCYVFLYWLKNFSKWLSIAPKITSIFSCHDWLFYHFYIWVSWRACFTMKYSRMPLNYLLFQSFRFDGKRKLGNLTELLNQVHFISTLPDSCYVYKMKHNNQKNQNDLIL